MCWVKFVLIISSQKIHFFFICSYELSKQLEPDDLPSSIYVPEFSLSSLSPSRIRRALRHVFNSKGNIVSDLSPSPTIHRATQNRLTPSLSERDIPSAIEGKSGPDDETGTHMENTLVVHNRKMERSLSLSPEIGRCRKSSAPEISVGHIIRIATTEHGHYNYKSLLVC